MRPDVRRTGRGLSLSLGGGGDGALAIGGPPPSGSACPLNCDHWDTVAAGSYTFTIDTLSGSFMAEGTLPAASGVVLLTINN